MMSDLQLSSYYSPDQEVRSWLRKQEIDDPLHPSSVFLDCDC